MLGRRFCVKIGKQWDIPLFYEAICGMTSKPLRGKHVLFNSWVLGLHVVSHETLRSKTDSGMKELERLGKSNGSQQEMKGWLLLHVLLVTLFCFSYCHFEWNSYSFVFFFFLRKKMSTVLSGQKWYLRSWQAM